MAPATTNSQPVDPSRTAGPSALFGPDPVQRRKRTRRRRGTATVIIAAVTLGAAVAVAGARSEDGNAYRTTSAGRHDVEQVLALVGTIEPVSQATVAFPVAGTVASVDVGVGDQLAVGQRLARLDTDDLESDRRSAQAALDQADLKLARALDGEDVSASGMGSTAMSASSSSSSNAVGTSVAGRVAASSAKASPSRASAAMQAMQAMPAMPPRKRCGLPNKRCSMPRER